MRIAVLMTGLMAPYQVACFRQLAQRDHELLVVHPPSLAYAPFEKAQFNESIRTHEWSTSGEMPTAENLMPTIEEFSPDVIIMYSWGGRGYRTVMRTFGGRALRVLFTSNFWHGSAKQYAGRLIHRIYIDPLFDCAWVPGLLSEQFAHRIGFTGKDIIRGANSADVEVFASGPRQGSEIAGRRRFLFTGRLIWHKAPTLLAEAYQDYRSVVTDPWDLDVVGDGPLRSDFEGVEGVRLRGFMQPPELAALMRESSCLVLPSHLEWFGVVVHEAAAAGLPLICSDGVGAVPHLLQDGYNGWTIEAGDKDELTAAMVRMSTLDEQRLGAMSEGSRALAGRLSPASWALHLEEEFSRRLRASSARG